MLYSNKKRCSFLMFSVHGGSEKTQIEITEEKHKHPRRLRESLSAQKVVLQKNFCPEKYILPVHRNISSEKNLEFSKT